MTTLTPKPRIAPSGPEQEQPTPEQKIIGSFRVLGNNIAGDGAAATLAVDVANDAFALVGGNSVVVTVPGLYLCLLTARVTVPSSENPESYIARLTPTNLGNGISEVLILEHPGGVPTTWTASISYLLEITNPETDVIQVINDSGGADFIFTSISGQLTIERVG